MMASTRARWARWAPAGGVAAAITVSVVLAVLRGGAPAPDREALTSKQPAVVLSPIIERPSRVLPPASLPPASVPPTPAPEPRHGSPGTPNTPEPAEPPVEAPVQDVVDTVGDVSSGVTDTVAPLLDGASRLLFGDEESEGIVSGVLDPAVGVVQDLVDGLLGGHRP